MVEMLLAAGADKEVGDRGTGDVQDEGAGGDGTTPLHLAAEGGHAVVVGMLLAAGAAVDAETEVRVF